MAKALLTEDYSHYKRLYVNIHELRKHLFSPIPYKWKQYIRDNLVGIFFSRYTHRTD